MNNESTEVKLELALMELFVRTEMFAQHFATSSTKEMFAEAVRDGAIDHQEAAHEAMQLIKRYGLQQRIDERTTLLRGSNPGSLIAAAHQYRIDELRKQKAAL